MACAREEVRACWGVRPYAPTCMRADLRRLSIDVERVAGTVHRHAADIAVIDNRCRERCARSELSSRARAIIGSAVVMAVASVVVALISLIGG